jgi:hypothetical protein
MLGIGRFVFGSLDLGTQRIGAVGNGPLGHQPGEHVPEHGERDAVVEVVRPPHHDRVPELLGSAGQLGDKSRLADAGVAADQEGSRPPLLDALELLEGDRQVELASDERWRPSRP